jgi:CRP-like cAMP-binding protein
MKQNQPATLLKLPAELTGRLAALSFRRRLKDGELLFASGDHSDTFYGVISGGLRVGGVTPEGKEMLIAFYGPGDWVGDVTFFGGFKHFYDAHAVGETELMAVPHARLDALLDSDPKLHRFFLQRLARALQHALSYFEDVAMLPVSARLARRLLELAERNGEDTADGRRINLRLSQEELGRMLGATRQSISKELKAWKSLGWIRIEYGTVVILQPAALKQQAGPALFRDPH